MHVEPPTYGADLDGLICGYLFKQGQAGISIHTAQALQHLSQPATDDFIWLHFNLSHVAAEKWLKDKLQLSEEFYEALHQGSRSTRIEHIDHHLLAVVNDVLHDFSFDASDIATLWLSVNSRYLISCRRKPLKSVDHLRDAVNRGALFNSSIELLTHLLRDQADVLINIVRNIIKKVDEIEDHLLANRLNQKRANLGELRRVLVRLQRLLAPEPAALFRLLQKPPVWLAENDVQELRQSTEEFALVLNEMSSLQERIKLLQEELAAIVNEKNSRSLFVLTIVTVLALPINIIAGLLGMNVGGIPLAQHEHGFLIVVLIVASFTFIAGWWAFRKADTE